MLSRFRPVYVEFNTYSWIQCLEFCVFVYVGGGTGGGCLSRKLWQRPLGRWRHGRAASSVANDVEEATMAHIRVGKAGKDVAVEENVTVGERGRTSSSCLHIYPAFRSG